MDTETFYIDFELLERCLEHAEGVVPVDTPQQLEGLIPDGIAAGRNLFLCELIKLDMSKSSVVGLNRKLDFYHTVLADAFKDRVIPLDLVLEEIQIQKYLGETVELGVLCKKYPHLSPVLERMITHTSTTVRQQRAQPTVAYSEGDRVGEFVILRRLGQGAFATVYLARQDSMRRLVALKVSHHRSDESVVLSQLDHPNIVRVYDQRIDSSTQANLLYMQYVPGGTLADVIQRCRENGESFRNGAILLESIDAALLAAGQQVPEDSSARDQLSELPWAEVVATLGHQLSLGLAHAHQQAVMHRDIKPANILLTMEGVPKLVDFNVSFAADISANAATHFGGSLGYMSPEQLEVILPMSQVAADSLDHRSDLYSLAVLLWELWQCERPWQLAEVPTNWVEAVRLQIESRQKDLPSVPVRITSTEYALEVTLREALSLERERRPCDGFVLAAKLKAALNPAIANLLEPPTESWGRWLLGLPILLVTSVIVFVPNGLAGAINFQFNQTEVRRHHEELLEYFGFVSLMINLVAFTTGAVILMLVITPIRDGIRHSRNGEAVGGGEIDRVWELGFLSAVIGGGLWLVAGLVFPICLGWIEPRFQFAESASFFLSLAGCGGMALIYPFFGLSWLSLQIYYPRLICQRMTDGGLKARVATMTRRSHLFLVAAGVIPLALLGLFVLEPDLPRVFNGICLALTAIGLVVSFMTHQRLLTLCRLFTEFVGDGRNENIVPITRRVS